MDITPPFGYSNIAPFLKTQRVKLPAAGQLPPFVAGLNAIPVSFTEFPVACRDYPLVFASGDEGKSVAPVAVLGLVTGENLFAVPSGWSANTYVPAYVRRYPFCMARVTLDAVEQAERLICIEKSAIAAEGDTGEPLFDAASQPLERWAGIEKLLNEYEADLERTREMSELLMSLGLLEPFSMQATPNGGAPLSMTGMFRVAEAKIEHLSSDDLRVLIRKGVLGRIYVHLLSLDNFGRLLERRAAQAG